jgi:hypothetical protein
VSIVAFAGPSLPPEDRGGFAGVAWRPPAAAGDLLRLDGGASLTICLIDGYFDHRPAVRHKEILLLLSEGVRILGASSIGALRAAEMGSFGLIGIGGVCRAYRDGRICGDDEVALVHAGEEWGWRALSVPLVDVRASLCRALRMRLIDKSEAVAVREAAQGIYYVDRTWQAILAALPQRLRDRTRALLPVAALSVKRLDALACVEAAVRTAPRRPARPRRVRTAFLDALALECGVDPDARLRAPRRAGQASTRAAPPPGRDCG